MLLFTVLNIMQVYSFIIKKPAKNVSLIEMYSIYNCHYIFLTFRRILTISPRKVQVLGFEEIRGKNFAKFVSIRKIIIFYSNLYFSSYLKKSLRKCEKSCENAGGQIIHKLIYAHAQVTEVL
jgi:hypothetical protein